MVVPAAGDYTLISQYIEGYRVADLQYGTANAKYAILRFCASAPTVPKNMCVSIRNIAGTACIVFDCVVDSTTPKEYVYVIPPCTIGAWATDSSYVLSIRFAYISGSTFVTSTTGAWVSGSFYGTSKINIIPPVSGLINVGDVGFYADPNMTGVPPEFQQNNYEDDFTDCLRYWYKAFALHGPVLGALQITRAQANHPVPLRATGFTVTLVGTALRLYDGGVAPNMTGIPSQQATLQYLDINLTASAGGFTIGRPGSSLVDGQETNYIAVSSR